MSEETPSYGKDPFCAGEVRLVVNWQGNRIARVGHCSRPLSAHLGHPCATKVALLTVFGHRLEVEVEWEGPVNSPNYCGPSTATPPAVEPPPARPGAWTGPKSTT